MGKDERKEWGGGEIRKESGKEGKTRYKGKGIGGAWGEMDKIRGNELHQLAEVRDVVAGDHGPLLEGAHLPHLLDLLKKKKKKFKFG